jgi:hypothetical protein
MEYMPLAEGLLRALEQSTPGHAMRTWTWLYPAVNTAHLLGIGLLFGSIVIWDLRLLGLGRHIAVSRLARHLLPFTLLGFATAALSGFGLFLTEPAAIWPNPMFRAKLAIIALAGLNAAAFHLGVYRFVAEWDASVSPPIRARLAGGLSLVLWSGAIVCGRFIAYV